MKFDGNKLKKLRGNGRREALAAALGVTAATVQNWEDGETTPTADKLAKLSEFTGKPIQWFFAGN